MEDIVRQTNITVAMAAEQDMEAIFRLRHEVYASELRQHEENREHRLTDDLDSFNSYIVARVGGVVVGFVSITPPGQTPYSVDKYFSREEMPVLFDDSLYEIRLLTVDKPFRGSLAAPVLMYAALRWIEARGGRSIISIGRIELLGLYGKAGLRPVGKRVSSGAVTFELLTGTVASARECVSRSFALRRRLEGRIEWRMETPFEDTGACYHGGAFFDAIGREFDNLEGINDVINADVLDAWFPPSPRVIDLLNRYLSWSVQTSPPTECEGLITWIAQTRGIEPESILQGAGSSSLIFLALTHWLTPSSRALILDPTYGEYAHVLEEVVRCDVDRVDLDREDGYQVDPARLEEALAKRYDLAVIVNPNNPTGRHISRQALEDLLRRVPTDTIVWIDETYIDYVCRSESLESFASGSRNVVVCKSMSKAYALSGLRVAYLCGPPHLIRQLRIQTPPWSVSLPGQIAGVMALQDPGYYEARYRETDALRRRLADEMMSLADFDIIPGVANYLLCHLPASAPTTQTLIERCREHNLFIRDAATTAPRLGPRAFRIAAKDAATNQRMVSILARALIEARRG